MTKKLLLWLLGFLLSASFLTFVAWCSAYDFNYRHPHVGMFVFMGTAFSALIGFVMGLIFDQR